LLSRVSSQPLVDPPPEPVVEVTGVEVVSVLVVPPLDPVSLRLVAVGPLVVV
jgi:hypothetical protein